MTTYEIGHYYSVPCVKTTKEQYLGRGEWVPVIGPLHEDAEIIRFPYPHWHIDWRFVTQKQVDRVPNESPWSDDRMWFGRPLHLRTSDKQRTLVESGSSPVLRKMKCQRAMPSYPHDAAMSAWLPQLEAVYAQCTLKNMICPHRGLPLDGVEQHGDIVTCPGHGLRWNIQTGKACHRKK